MKKHMTVGVLLLLILAASLAFVAGCASTRIKRLTGAEFMKHAKQTDLLGSIVWASYIGSTHDRAYLEYGRPAFIGSGMQVTVFWTPLSELPSNIVSQIESGMQPWTNAMDRIAPRLYR